MLDKNRLANNIIAALKKANFKFDPESPSNKDFIQIISTHIVDEIKTNAIVTTPSGEPVTDWKVS